MRFLATSLFSACLLLACSSAWARLGDTEKQCAARYGKSAIANDLVSARDFDGDKPVQQPEKYLNYQKNGASILVGFVGGKATSVQYTFPGRKTPLGPHEVEKLLKLNAPSCRWYFHLHHPLTLSDKVPDELDQDVGIFWSTDGKYYATFARRSPVFAIMESSHRPIFRFSRTEPASLDGF